MEPPDVSSTDNNTMSTKRRISSILKAPRTSISISSPQKVKCQVEVAKPVEKKRNSKRVSFAPSNDVVLFSEKVKNGSPVCSPLQDITTSTENIDERLQRGVIESGPDLVPGIETLLNAPLYASKQRHKMMFNKDVQSSYGENTVMFTEDAIMDMTHSHTICISKNCESSVFLEDGGNIGTPKSGNMDFTFPVKKSNTEICGSTSSAPDPEFKDFLASLSKSSDRKEKSVVLNTAPLHSNKVEEKAFFAKLEAKRSSGVKENQAPVTSATRRNFPMGSVTPQQHVLLGATTMQTDIGPPSMDLTENVQGFTSSTFRLSSLSADPDDMEMTRSQTVAIDSKIIGVIGCLRNERCEGVALTQDPNRTQIFSNDNHGMELTTPLNPPLKESQDFRTMQTESPRRWFPKENWLFSDVPVTVVPNQTLGRVSRYGDDSDDMELTRSQNVTIDPKTMTQKLPQSKTRRSSTEEEHGILSEDCCGMDMTEALTGPIVAGSHTASKDAINVYLPTQEMNQQSTTDCRLGSPVSDNMEITETVYSKSCLIEMPQPSKGKSRLDFTAHVPAFSQYSKCTHEAPNGNSRLLQEQDTGYNASVASSEPDDMEITRSQTVVIDSKSLKMVHPLQTKRKSTSFFPFNLGNQISEDCGMDMTKPLTVSIDHVSESSSGKMTGPVSRFVHEAECSPHDMEMTRSQTVVIDSKSLKMVHPFQTKQKSTSFFPFNIGNKMSEDCDMDMTKPLTASSKMTGPVSRFVHEAECSPHDMEMTRSQTVVIESKNQQRVGTSSLTNERTVGILETNLSQEDNGMKMTAFAVPTVERFSTSIHEKEIISSQSTNNIAVEVYTHDIKVGHSFDPPLSLCSNYMDIAESQPVFADFDGNRFKARKSLSSNANKSLLVDKAKIPADQSACADMALQDCAIGLCSEAPTMSDFEDMELTRSQTVAIEAKHIGHLTLEETKINRNQECPREMSLPTVGFSCSANISVKDDEIEMIKTATKASEQTYSPTNAKETTKPIFHLTKSGETTTNLANLEPKDITNMHVPQLKDRDEYNLCKPESSHITNLTSTQDLDTSNKRNRRRSLADLQSKLQHMSRMINESPEVLPMGSVTAPICQLLRSPEKPSLEIESQPVDGNNGSENLALTIDKEESTNSEDHHSPNEKHFMTAPLNLKSKCLASKLAFGSFKPKLPQRNRPIQNTSNCVADEKPLKTKNMELNNELYSSTLVDEINDEVIPNISDEELSETLDTKSLQGIDDISSEDQFNRSVLKDFIYEEPVLNMSQGQKRPLPENDHKDTANGEKRRKSSTDNIEETGTILQEDHSGPEALSHVVQWDSKGPTAAVPLHGADGSNSTNIRHEATFESTYRHSQFESQLEDTGSYTNDMRKKLEDGSITVKEYLKLFSIDFVIDKPRQSILPAKALCDLDCKTEDMLIEMHINRPKQRVYETDCKKLTKMVEGLKARMKERDNLLKTVNGPLWEATKGFSEKEFQCFGAKLKERRNFYRKRSKVQSHEMKAVLYTNLVEACQESQQNLRGKIEQTDGMLNDLDECIHVIEAELAAVEGEGADDSEPTLKSRQQDLENVNKKVADNERQMCELVMQKNHSIERVGRLQNETHKLGNAIAMLDRLNEWKLGEQDENRTIYTFLHESLHLEVLMEKANGRDDVQVETERNIMDVTFQLHLDDQKSQCQARLVHRLLSQYLGDETSWVKKYPTSRYVSKLLHDVGLVVSRCRLLGEEVHRLKMWGALRLDILDISCVDTQISILFSSLKAGAKFEITIGVTSAYPYCLLQVQNFQNRIGNTTIHQLEEIVFSVTPSKDYLTKIVKNIHGALLC
ncbi:uncharacterized protein knl1 [Hypomesus transpacificus]|uniref:uncharacterized protein knl1 n=1 Tax=Hypomesus transpacificus TaxID=137520 RepID=UPI001F07C8FB|nr:uncharacterized protein knl1 [Hypomesus transpacificus]